MKVVKIKTTTNSCGKGKKGCSYEGEPMLIKTVKLAA